MEFIGFDTETIHGYCRLIGVSTGEHYIVKSLKDLITFFKKYRGKVLIAFNADYDIQAMLKYLPEKELQYIMLGLEVEYEGITFLYYRKKFLRFNNAWIFDCYQYYHMSLRKAAEKYLKGRKGNVDASRITEKNIYSKKVIKYCVKDSKLCYDLMLKFTEALPNELKNVKPISTAFYSAKYFRRELEQNRIPVKVNIMARQAYHGGLFTINTRGYFKDLYNYDICSAYPYEICKLRSMAKFELIRQPSYIPDATYGFYYIRVDIQDKYVGPLIYKTKNLCLCPVGKYEGIVTKAEFEAVREYDPQILAATHIFAGSNTPFKERMEYVFHRKCTDENGYVWKILANSLYGRTAMATKKLIDGDGQFDVNVLDVVEKDGRNFYKIEDIDRSNFVYASEITAQTRLRMYRNIKKYRKHIIAVQTDSLVADKPLTDLEVAPDKLGAWKLEHWQEAYMIGSGVYFYKDDKGVWHYKFRGFNFEGEGVKEVLERVLNTKGLNVEFDVKRRISIQEARRTHDDSMANEIVNVTRKLNLNFDKKRIWLGEWKNGKDVGRKRIDSIAIFLKDFACEVDPTVLSF